MRNASLALLVGLLLAFSGSAEADFLDSLEAYWSFDTDFTDSSGNGRDATVRDSDPAVVTAAGDWILGGGALSLDGGDSLQVPGWKGVGGTTARTMAGWIRTTDNTGAILAWGQDQNAKKWHFRTQIGNGTAGGIRVEVSGGFRVSQDAVTDGVWHHVAAVLPAPANNVNQVLLYMDGALQGNSATNPNPINTSSGIDVRIGSDHNPRRLDGELDELGVWSRALDAAEIAGLYNGGAGRDIFAKPELIWDGLGAGNWGHSRWTGGPPDFPDETTNATIDTPNTVTVAAPARSVYDLTMSNGGAVAIGAGNSLSVGRTLDGAGGSVSLGDGASLAVGAGGTIEKLNVDASATSATVDVGGALAVSGAIFDGGGAAVTFEKKGSGTLSLDNSTGTGVIGTQNMTFDVHQGTLHSSGLHPLGEPAAITLSGGTLSVEGAVTIMDALQASRLSNNGNQASLNMQGTYTDDGDGTFSGSSFLLGSTPTDTAAQTAALSYNENTISAFFGRSGNLNEYQAWWTGYYNAQVDGDHVFGIYRDGGGNNIDDHGSLYVDYDGDGSFATDGSEGFTTGGQGTRTFDLTANTSYAVAFGFNEDGGGDHFQVEFQEPAGGTYTTAKTVVDPAAQAGYWTSNAAGAIDMRATPIDVTDDSTLNASTGVPPAQFGDLTIQDGKALATTGADMTFESVTIAGGPTRSATLAPENQVTMDSYNDGGAGNDVTFHKGGGGTLVLDNSGSNISGAATTFEVTGGTLFASGSDPLGGSPLLRLAGGTGSFGDNGGPADVSGIHVLVTADSTLDSQSSSPLTFPDVKIENNRRLTTTGSDLSISGLALPGGGTGILAPQNTLTLTGYNDSGSTIRMDGPGTLAIDNSGGGVDARNTTLEVSSGTLAATGTDASAVGNSSKVVLSGGTFTVTSDSIVAPFAIADAINHYGYHINNDNLALDLNNNAGMMGGGDPTTFQNYYGRTLLTDGPDGNGLEFDNDTEFQNAGVIASNRDDNYSNLWVATLHVSADDAGDWEFRQQRSDDRAGFWLDLDQDGVFESTTSGLGNDRGEQLRWENNTAKTENLAEGDYLMAFTHREGGSGSTVDFFVKSPNMAAEEVVQPTAANQLGLWSAVGWLGPIDLSGTDVEVTSDSTLNPVTHDEATFGALTLVNSTLTATGALGGIVFDRGTTVDGNAAVGINTAVDVTAGAFDGGGSSATFTKTGTAALTLGPGISGTDDMSFDVQQGRLATRSAATVDSLKIAGSGTVDTGGPAKACGSPFNPDNVITIRNSLEVGGAVYTPEGGGELGVAGSDLAARRQIVLNGGTTSISGGGSPVAYWSFDKDDDPNPGHDDTGNGHEGTVNGATWVPGGRLGGALSFDAADDYVSIDGYKGITGTDARSMAAWIQTINDTDHSIISWGTDSGGQKWNFRVQNTNGTAGAIRVEVNGGYIVSNLSIADGQWHHVAATWEDDGSPNVNDVKLYIDGVLETTSAVQGRSINTASGRDVYLGRDHRNDHYFDGLMDEVYLFGVALDPAAIQSLYATGVHTTNLDLRDTDLLVEDASILGLDANGTVDLGELALQLLDGAIPLTLETDASHIDFESLNILDPTYIRIPGQVYDLIALTDAQGSPRTGIFGDEMFGEALFNCQSLSMLDGEILYSNDGSLVQFKAYIPEPATLTLLGLGALGLLRRRRRQQASKRTTQRSAP